MIKKSTRNITNVVKDVIPRLSQSERKFSYFLFPVLPSGGDGSITYTSSKGTTDQFDINPMDEVIKNFDTIYRSGIPSLSFYYFNYYNLDDLKKLSKHVQPYITG